jgi:hypothetical protein
MSSTVHLGWPIEGALALSPTTVHGAQINFGDLAPYISYDQLAQLPVLIISWLPPPPWTADDHVTTWCRCRWWSSCCSRASGRTFRTSWVTVPSIRSAFWAKIHFLGFFNNFFTREIRLGSSVSNPYSMSPDLDPAFISGWIPIRIRIPSGSSVSMTKNWKKYTAEKFDIF